MRCKSKTQKGSSIHSFLRDHIARQRTLHSSWWHRENTHTKMARRCVCVFAYFSMWAFASIGSTESSQCRTHHCLSAIVLVLKRVFRRVEFHIRKGDQLSQQRRQKDASSVIWSFGTYFLTRMLKWRKQRGHVLLYFQTRRENNFEMTKWETTLKIQHQIGCTISQGILSWRSRLGSTLKTL